ncbi:MAG: aminomethyl transferase family protein [Actinobacteria bacterium]|nr:MAG: aminomethyl transferase family protein [Actinomycetota bacterium]
MTRGTAFHERTSRLNERLSWEDWWGYAAASAFGDAIDIEYNAVREAAGAIDVSPLFKYVISGPDAGRLIDRVITRNVAEMQVGQVFYTPWCDERGKLIDDGTVARLDEDSYRWTAAEPNYRWIKLNAGGLDVRIEDVSAEVAALALQGPTSRAILEAVTGEEWSGLKYFRRRSATIDGIAVDVSRTGYTGDLGYELWVQSGRAVDLWDALFRAGEGYGLRAVGMSALDVLRVEAGLILLDAEFTGVRNAFSAEQEYSPFELGLGRLVDFTKERFVGKGALLSEQKAGGPPRRLVGLEHDWRDVEGAFARHGLPTVLVLGTLREAAPVHAGVDRVGKATSTTWSPTLKKVISLALVDRTRSTPGMRLDVEWTVEGARERVGATVVELPFLDLPRKRD